MQSCSLDFVRRKRYIYISPLIHSSLMDTGGPKQAVSVPFKALCAGVGVCVRAPPDLNSIPCCFTDKILNDDDDDLHRSNEQQARATGRRSGPRAGWLAGVTTSAEHALLLPCSFRKASSSVRSWTLEQPGATGNARCAEHRSLPRRKSLATYSETS